MPNSVQLLEAEYSLVVRQDVIWGDMDAYGHVNNTVFFRYFEDARMAFFEKAGVSEHKEHQDVGPILAATQCNFRKPLDYPDRIHIAARSFILSPKKIRMEYAVFSERHQAIAADGEALVVYYDYVRRRSCEIPSAIAQAIEAL